MLLLSGHTLTVKSRFVPESMSLSLTHNGISTANMTVGPDAPTMAVNDWLQDNTEPGAGIVWRVKGIDTDMQAQTRTIQLEHVIATLKDVLLFGETTTKAISGGNNATSSQTIAYVLRGQSIWQVGTISLGRSLPYNFNNTTAYDAIMTVCNTLDNWIMEYDLTSLPFKLSVRTASNVVACELREMRNLTSVRRSVDRTNMYTRFYPVGANNMHISGNYVSRNEGTYGVISKTEADQSITSEAMLRAWAEERLRRHAEPNVTVTISGYDLSSASGESLDKIRLGMMCRVPLPEYNTTITERVVKLQWPDKMREPARFTATLANQLQDVASVIQRMSSQSARSSGGAALAGQKQQEEDHAWMVDTTDHIGLVAEAVAGEGAAQDWSRVSSIMVDGEGIHQRVTKTEGDLVTAESRIDVTEKGITSLVTKTGVDELGENETLYSKIDQAADKISLFVSDDEYEDLQDFLDRAGSGSFTEYTRDQVSTIVKKTGINKLTGENETLYSRITQTANELCFAITGKKSIKSLKDFLENDGSGSILAMTNNSLTSLSGTVSGHTTKLGNIEATMDGSGLFQDPEKITGLVGKFKVTSKGNVQLLDGAQLYIDKNGAFQRVGTLQETKDWTNDRVKKLVTGTQFWQNRDSIGQVAGKFEVDDDGYVHLKTGARMYVNRNKAVLEVCDAGNVKSQINASKEKIKIQADKIELSGYVTATKFDALEGKFDKLMTGETVADKLAATLVAASKLEVNTGGKGYFKVGNSEVEWKSISVVTKADITLPSITTSSTRAIMYAVNGQTSNPSTMSGQIVTAHSNGSVNVEKSTFYYLGMKS